MIAMTISTSLKVAPLSMLFTATILAAVGNLKNNVIQQPKKSQLMITDTLNMVIVSTLIRKMPNELDALHRDYLCI